MQLSIENQRWIADFHAEHGRSLRILHIGNIANNAYNNAKILNAVGVENDVICFDYYHVMACPEWEDADFSSPSIDHFRPDWTVINTNSFERPRWFVQGPREMCIDYLIAKRNNHTRQAIQLWNKLEIENKTRKPHFHEILLVFFKAELRRLLTSLSPRALAAPVSASIRNIVFRILLIPRKLLRLLLRCAVILLKLLLPLLKLLLPQAVISSVRSRIRKIKKNYDLLWLLLTQAVISSVRSRIREIKKNCDIRFKRRKGKQSYLKFEEKLSTLVADFCTLYPERYDKLVASDMASYLPTLRRWQELFKLYDIVQGYSTDGIYPMLVGARPYFAYEHGTIREIPFQDNNVSRLTALSYRLADGSFITNTDNIAAAHKLGLEAGRTHYLPHAFDYRKLHKFAGDKLYARPKNDVFKIFSPCRQHWVDNDPGWSKGNDILIRAVSILSQRGYNFMVEMVEWGEDLKASKKLINDLGVQGYFKWVPQLTKEALWTKYLTADVVVDQFVISVISGVTFEALSLGCPVITADDGTSNRKFFGVAPPILGCWSSSEVAEAVKLLMNDEGSKLERGIESIEWIKGYHSPTRVADTQISAYRKNVQ